MNRISQFVRHYLLPLLLITTLLLAAIPSRALTAGPDDFYDRQRQDTTPTPTDTELAPIDRPIVVVDTYKLGGEDKVSATQEVNLIVKLHNDGRAMAFNLVVTFTSTDFVLRGTGGVTAVRELDPGENHRIEQPMTATYDVIGKSFASVAMTVAYNDEIGNSYSQSFNLTVPVLQGRAGPTSTGTPTPTPRPVLRPQLVVTGYSTDVDVLQPGSMFALNLDVSNVGNSDAKRVTMIMGGGSSSSGSAPTTDASTPDANSPGSSGGVSGGSGDFANFAPVSSSNIQYLGDLDIGAKLSARISLIVNATTNPGAYPLKMSFAYIGDNNINFTDDQVVTLLVYSPPLVEVNFYRDPGALIIGQPNQLPIQVVNLGRKQTLLGNMKVTGEGEFSNNTTLVGPLDTGGYFTLDAMMMPSRPGSQDVLISIDYTDDFNQPQIITRTIQVNVIEMPTMEPGLESEPPGGELPVPEPESFGQQLLRFIRGLFGLDSGQATPVPDMPLPEENPPGEVKPGVGGGGKG